MTDGQTYYDGLIQQGYPTDQALTYTQQYYPSFAPMNLATTPMPMPTPQPIQPMMQQPVQQMAQPMMTETTEEPQEEMEEEPKGLMARRA